MPVETVKRSTNNRTVHLWLGCTTRAFLQDSAKNLFRLLDKFKIDFEIIDDIDVCCGSVLFVTGQKYAAMDNLKQVEKVLRKKNVKHLTSICPGCTRTFKFFYEPRRSNSVKKVEHYTETLLANLEEVSFKNTDRVYKATYHDPCHLARHMGITEPPREIIKALPGVEFIELTTNRQDAFCCGSGGGMRSYDKELADNASLLRLQEADELGVDILLTSCPFCERSFKMAQELPEAPKGLKVLNIVDFLPRFL